MNVRLTLAVAALALAFVGGSAHAAAPIVVHSTAELVAAVDAANLSAGPDIITLAAGTYVLTSPLQPTGTLELDGAGAATTLLDGNGAGRVIDASGADSLTVSGLRITNGKELGGAGIFTGSTTTLDVASSTFDHNSASPGGSGGALLTNGPTTLRDVTLTNNDAGQGAGIFSQGSLTVIGSTITHNAASGFGANSGGIGMHGGTFLLLDSVVSDNTVDASAFFGSSIGQAGGVWSAAGRTVIDSTTISGNTIVANGTAVSYAGGLRTADHTTITNSTISGNTALSVGGIALGGRTSIVNSTISGNISTGPGQPGGISTTVDGTEIVSSTIADNIPSNVDSLTRIELFATILRSGAGGTDCTTGGFPNHFVSEGHNVSSDASCVFNGPTDVQNEDALLGTLQDNGGGVQTRLPGNGSPALAILPAGTAVPATDARGVFRPASGADAGAAERAASTVGVTVSLPSTLYTGEAVTAVMTLRNRSGSPVTGASVTFDGTTRTIGTLAAGAADVELFPFTAPTALSCLGGTTTYAFAAAWNGTTRSGSAPTRVSAGCGGVGGRVLANGLAVTGGKVDVCLTTLGTCTEVTTNGAGDYEALVPNGDYTVKAFPTAASPPNATTATVGPVSVHAPTIALQDVALTAAGPPPSNVTVTSSIPPAQNGLPSVARGAGAGVTFTNPCSGSAPTGWTVASGGTVVASGTFTGAVSPPFIFHATIPPNLTLPGGIGVFAASCGSAPNPSPWPFRYFDPSGTVRDAAGARVAGATVTLLRSDSASGPFAAVANGSDTMSPENRRNPDTTLDDGSYAWDVTGGFYKVHAEKNGCTADSAVLTVPPPATGIDLVLACPAAPAPAAAAPSSSSGGSSAPVVTTPVVTPPTFTPPAKLAAPTVTATTLHTRRVRGGWIVSGSFSLDEQSVVRLRLLKATIAPGSVIGGVHVGRPHAQIVTTASGRVAVQLRATAHPAQLEIVATNADGAATTLLVPVR